MSTRDAMRTGRCLCGGVRYELEGELPPLVNCHCRFCRRAHGAAFVTLGWVRAAALRVVSGEELLERFAVARGYRSFCRRCGTRLWNGSRDADFLSLVVGTLDDADHAGPVLHLNLESKAPWYEIHDDLPRYDRSPPGVGDDD